MWPEGRDGASEQAHLECDPAGGTHRNAAAACEALAAHPDALEPVPEDAICTAIYGGPQEAEVVGRFRGREVEARFDRRNGCEIDRWDRLELVFQLEGP